MCLPFGLWIRSSLPETVQRREDDAVATKTAGAPLRVVRDNARILVLGLLILASGTIVTYVTQYMTTYAEKTLEVPPTLASPRPWSAMRWA